MFCSKTLKRVILRKKYQRVDPGDGVPNHINHFQQESTPLAGAFRKQIRAPNLHLTRPYTFPKSTTVNTSGKKTRESI